MIGDRNVLILDFKGVNKLDKVIIKVNPYKGKYGYILGYVVDMVKIRVILSDVESDLLLLYPHEYSIIED